MTSLLCSIWLQIQRNAWQFRIHKGPGLRVPKLCSKLAPFVCFISRVTLFNLSFPGWLWRRKAKRRETRQQIAPLLNGRLEGSARWLHSVIPSWWGTAPLKWSVGQTGYKLAVVGVGRLQCCPESCWSVCPTLGESFFKKSGPLILWWKQKTVRNYLPSL